MQNRSLKIASFNINGVLNPVKRGKILSKLRKDKIQIAFLQETHLSDSEHTKLNKSGFKHVYFSSHRSGKRRGVAILSNTVNYEHRTQTNNDKQIDAFLSQVNLPKITDDQNEKLISKITKEEIQSAIGRMKVGKSPGTDGFPTEWYKTMQDQLIL